MERLENNKRVDRDGKVIQTGDRVMIAAEVHSFIPACADTGYLDYTRQVGRCDIKLDSGETITMWPQDVILLQSN